MLNEVNQLKRTVDQYRSEGLTDRANELLEEQGGDLDVASQPEPHSVAGEGGAQQDRVDPARPHTGRRREAPAH